MPYRIYTDPEEYHRECVFWGRLEKELNQQFQPNPWIFEMCYHLLPNEQRYLVIFRNFDGSKHLTADVTSGADGFQSSLLPSPQKTSGPTIGF